MLIEAGCEGSTVEQCRLTSQGPSGTLSRPSFDAKSNYVSAPLPQAGVSAVVAAVSTLEQTLPEVGGGFVFDSYGGEIAKVEPSATAFVHRSALCGVQYSFFYGAGAPMTLVDSGRSWLADAEAALQPYVEGAYVNYIDPSLTYWQQAYYGSNLQRLVAVKQSVDPDNFFRFAQSIPTTVA